MCLDSREVTAAVLGQGEHTSGVGHIDLQATHGDVALRRADTVRTHIGRSQGQHFVGAILQAADLQCNLGDGIGCLHQGRGVDVVVQAGQSAIDAGGRVIACRTVAR